MEAFITESKNRGLRVLENVEKGEFIIDYVGKIVPITHQGIYCLEIRPGLKIDAEICGNEAKYINHSCSPNCEMQEWTVDCRPVAALFLLYCSPHKCR